jgi:hypothetical protein
MALQGFIKRMKITHLDNIWHILSATHVSPRKETPSVIKYLPESLHSTTLKCLLQGIWYVSFRLSFPESR